MDFTFNEDQTAILEAVREFCREELAPRAKETYEAAAWPAENVRKLAELDLMGVPIPEEYDGLGMDFLTWSAIGEELSCACTTTGAVYGAHALALVPIMMFGTKEQKRKHLVPLAKGEQIGAFGLTEPGAGSDAGAVATKAIRDGDHYVLNGTKIFISNGGEAQTYVIVTSTDPSRGARGLTTFIVEKGTSGFEFGKDEKKMAFPSLPNRELVFTDCRVPKENMLGRENAGFLVAMRTLAVGRIGMATGAVGVARAALEAAVPYTHQRQQFGQPISNFQAIQFMVADMATEVDCARLLTWRAAWLKDQGKPFEKEAAMAKLYASEVAMRTTTKAVQIFGGYGYTREFPVERYMREAKLFEIVEGTSEVQRMVIANHVLRELNR